MSNGSSMRSISRFIIVSYIQLFISIIIVSLFLISWILFYQTKEIEISFLDKIANVLEQHKYILLNETALDDTRSLSEHIKQIANQLNLDAIKYIHKSNFIIYPLSSKADSIPYYFNVSDKFNNYPINLEIYYKNSLKNNYFYPLVKIIVAIYSIFLLAIYSIFYILFYKIKNNVIEPINLLTSMVDQPLDLVTNKCFNQNIKLAEIDRLYNKIIEYKNIEAKNRELELKDVEISTREAISRQVAHDIRSPIAVLNMMIRKSLNNIEEEIRIVIRNQIDRIQDIANNLIFEHKTSLIKNNLLDTSITEQLLSSTIEEIITEKRIYFRPKLGVVINANIYDSSNYGLFARINTKEFKNILSNIINNSVEAFLNEKGTITVHLYNASDDIIKIVIEDDGIGIPQDIIQKIGEIGFSYGKEKSPNSGTGFGLYYARETLKKWGGTLSIESSRGVKVTISLPKVDPPYWFIPKINIYKGQAVVILDDDQGIHFTWSNCFSELINNSLIDIFNISNPTDFESWINCNSMKYDQIIYLSDFELLGYDQSGLDLLEKFHLNNSILVTSYYEDDQIRNRCLKLGIKIIPKMLAGFVPIEFINHEVMYEYVYIDDDKYLRKGWEFEASKYGLSILTLDNVNSFDKYKESISFERTKIYIDSNLGPHQIRGEIFAKQLYDQGYKNIYLATAYPPEMFAHWPWVKVVGKEFPNLQINFK